MSDFVHLHLHSQYSLLDGANRIADVVAAAAEAGMPALALTDHGNMFGAVEFYDAAHKAGIKPILGIEAYVAQGSRLERNPQRSSSNHLVLLARNEAGYRNLLKLTTRSYLEGFYYKPRIDHELLAEHGEGLICLSACLKGELNELILARREREAEELACRYRDLFGSGNFFIELQDHGIPEQRVANEVLRQIARRTGIPLVVSNDCHYLRKDDSFAHDVLLCIGTQKVLSDPDRMRYAAEQFYLRTAEEMFARFPNDAQAIENTVAIAERCQVEIERGQFYLPEFPVPEGHSLESYFEEVTRAGFAQRLGDLERRHAAGRLRHPPEAYRQRLDFEIDIIRKMGFSGYFLITWDFCRFARERGIPVGPGRGSAAGSLVSYVLGITDIDPLRYDLLFERFLNPERVSMPDIDIDFCMRRRGEVIQYVNEKYGRDHVAQIITFGTLAAKAAIRDVGRVMGVPYAKVDRIAKLVPDMTRSLASAAEEIEALKAEVERDPEVRQIVEVGSRLEGLTRHHSMHAAGVVITPQPIEELVPLCKTNNDEVLTQWDKDVVESLGLLKLDFLGLRTLTVIDDTLKLLAHQGIELDLDEVPLDDEQVYQLFCDGRTNGIFQFESGGMKDLLRRAKPSKFDDLAAFNALYRPGALSVGMVEEFIQRKQGKKKVFYLLPETRPILEETYGVIAYQEQVMKIAVEVAGFTRGEADVLRKAMGKKKAEVMAQQKEKFVDGAERKGIDPAKAKALWDQIEPFAGYGFNKSHSVAYAILAYKTAYLKTHYPVAFMAAMLSSEMSSKDNVGKYIQECRDMGIEVLPPDVNESSFAFTVSDGAVRFGLGAVKGVGEGAVEAILAARRQVHRFRSLAHFAVECDLKAVNHKVFECLIKGGAFDGLRDHRAALVEALDRIFEYGQERRREREMGQGTLFGASDLQEPQPDAATPEWPEKTRLRMEKEALGLYLTGNPLSEHQGQLESLTTHRTSELEGVEGKVTLGGLVTRIRRTKIKSGPNAGRLMGRFVLEDLHGTLPVTLFADNLQRFDHLLEEDRPIVVTGLIRDRGAESELTAEEIVPLEAATGKLLKEVELSVGDSVSRSELLALREALHDHRGEVPVCLVIRLADHTVQIVPQLHGVRFDDDLRRTVEEILGPGTVRGRYAIAQA